MITKIGKLDAVLRIASLHGYEGPFTGFSLCAKCGGLCCLKNSCCCIPEDFDDLSPEGIEAILDTGKYMICAFFEAVIRDEEIFINVIPAISAREVECPDNGILISLTRSKCANLDKNGCMLNEDERPSQGLTLIPVDENGCRCFLTNMCDYWEDYLSVLNEVIKKRTGKTVNEIFLENYEQEVTQIKEALQEAVVECKSVPYQVYKAAQRMDKLFLFRAVFGPEIGEAMKFFIEWVEHDNP